MTVSCGKPQPPAQPPAAKNTTTELAPSIVLVEPEEEDLQSHWLGRAETREFLQPKNDNEKLMSVRDVKLTGTNQAIQVAFYYLEKQAKVDIRIFRAEERKDKGGKPRSFDPYLPISISVFDMDGDRTEDLFIEQDGRFLVYLNNSSKGTFKLSGLAPAFQPSHDPRHKIRNRLGDIDGDGVYEILRIHEVFYQPFPIIEVQPLLPLTGDRPSRRGVWKPLEIYDDASRRFLERCFTGVQELGIGQFADLNRHAHLDLDQYTFHYILNKRPPLKSKGPRGRYRVDFEIQVEVRYLYCGCRQSLAIDSYRFVIPEAYLCVFCWPGISSWRGGEPSQPFVRGTINPKLNQIVSQLLMKEFEVFKREVLEIAATVKASEFWPRPVLDPKSAQE
ncbi:MAG: VCBS repeat-containing protein [Verrucomicrobiota bacterium]